MDRIEFLWVSGSVVFGILSLILFFKNWRMADDIRDIRNYYLEDKIKILNEERKTKNLKILGIIILIILVIFGYYSNLPKHQVEHKPIRLQLVDHYKMENTRYIDSVFKITMEKYESMK